MDYGGKYLKIRKALHEANFDEFYQAGSVGQFHKMNIVAESTVLRMRFWFCIDGGYSGKDNLYIVRRKLPESGQDERIYYNNQKEMAIAIGKIGMEIRRQKMKGKIYTHDEAALYGSTYYNLMDGVEVRLADLLSRHTPYTEIVQGEFSGNA